MLLQTCIIIHKRSELQCWISVSGTVDVQPGHSVTLQCSISTKQTHTFWSRLVNRTEVNCISSMYGSEGKASFCDGIQSSKYEMRSDISTIFLTIKHVDVSDSGLYLCGFYQNGHTILQVVDLRIQGDNEPFDDDTTFQKEPDVLPHLMGLTLGVIAVFLLLIIIVLTVKYRKLQKAHSGEQDSHVQNLGSDELNYAALSFQQKAKKNRRTVPEREPNVVYAATR
ncbi:hypothetical protein Q5P01_002235 [Channa striata]|uniref:Ig-like domain-containing protein n=1 Tax=Channa striata TaxID=64152 RepID=A0AA88NM81_CHASR|nr:hypothetical protein Q5P01_002235 [Channa striata]